MNISQERFIANFGSVLTFYVMQNSNVLMCKIKFEGKEYHVGYSKEMDMFYSASYLPDEQDCKHFWDYYKSTMFKEEAGYRQTKYVLIDYFHCKYCLKQKEERKEETIGQGGTIPEWYHDSKTPR